MDTKYLKKVGLYLLSVILAFALIFYIVHHLVTGFTTDITTISAEIRTNQDVISENGYIFRDEHYLYSSFSGAVNYMASNGEKVGIKQAVAQSFSDSAGYSIHTQLEEIEKKLSILEESKVQLGAANTDTETVDQKITSYYSMILSNIADGKYSHAMRSTDNLLIQMNRRQIITGEVKDFSAEESTLSAKKNELTSKLTGRTETVVSDMSGYFFSDIDGYENLFTTKALNDLTLSSFYELIEKDPQAVTNKNGKTPVGKIAESYKWYIAMPLNKKDAERLEIGETYEGIFPYNYETKIFLLAERILTEASDERAVAVFSCREMPQGFSYQRRQNVEIVLSSTEGYRIPTTAVRIIDGEKGVYTLYGSTVVFKRINILLEVDGYYIVSEDDPLSNDTQGNSADESAQLPTQKYSYISLYDKIIVSGKDLENGMVFY